ncbi:MAG: hypothetical protein AAFV45_12620 [Pseudomonadota bacterium]
MTRNNSAALVLTSSLLVMVASMATGDTNRGGMAAAASDGKAASICKTNSISHDIGTQARVQDCGNDQGLTAVVKSPLNLSTLPPSAFGDTTRALTLLQSH